ncbi:helix-turn-helix domain-containing protein [Halorhabdus rudnickae]|uniref:helix-turn-helix domain-containing protein n=1 Tax=Halorhabdus rudnickae TaxID=1775544 RepID=UPI001083DCE4|nr:helix-turn-helix domain-containing protein [Halorhabdus rudnickae]
MGADRREHSPATSGRAARPLRAVFEIAVADVCPLTDVEQPISSVTAQQVGEICECEVVTEGDGVDVLRLERERSADCLADVFHRHGYVPHITAVEDGSLRITVHPPDRASIGTLLEELRAIGYDVTTERIHALRGEDDETRSLALVDRSTLTDKQRTAVELALEWGYYDDNKRVTLATLADEFDISQSALSRRLRAAEAKLVRGVFSSS